MKVLNNTLLQASLLVLVLGFYAFKLGRDVARLRHWHTTQATTIDQNRRLVLLQPDGIDVYGKRVASPSSKDPVASIVFLLRGQSLQDDLAFWRTVAANLADLHKPIGMTAYCDSAQCVQSIRTMPQLSFSVLAAANATDIQALVNADSDGRAILRKSERTSPVPISWRGIDGSPQKVAQEVSR